MRRSTVFSIAAFVLMTLSLPALGQIFQDPTKWVQLPDMENGFDQQSQWDITDNEPNLVKADDWRCLDGLPVTDIHWWGSYFDDDTFQPDGFAILIYEDVELQPNFWGPGALLEDYFVPLAQANETPRGIDSVGETVYEYWWDIPEAEWFDQTITTWYWLSIVAVTPDIGNTPIWGWHTGFGVLDSKLAVKGLVPPGSVIPEGNPEMWQAVDYHFAFALTTIPEPGTLAILGFSALGLLVLRRRNK